MNENSTDTGKPFVWNRATRRHPPLPRRVPPSRHIAAQKRIATARARRKAATTSRRGKHA